LEPTRANGPLGSEGRINPAASDPDHR
jgi:hypothetical protein